MCFEYRTTTFFLLSSQLKRILNLLGIEFDKHNNNGIRFDKGDKQITADCRLNEAELIW